MFIMAGFFIFNNMDNAMLQMSADDLLKKIGSGRDMPGSGSVVALVALSNIELLVSVCKLTIGKKSPAKLDKEIAVIEKELLEAFVPQIHAMLNKDMSIVKEMVGYRVKRDNANSDEEREKYSRKADDLLKQAAISMLDLCSICIDIMPRTLHLYKTGLRSLEGECAVVLSNMISSVSGALYMALLNVKKVEDVIWVKEHTKDVEKYFGRLQEYKYVFNGKLAHLYNNIQEL